MEKVFIIIIISIVLVLFTAGINNLLKINSRNTYRVYTSLYLFAVGLSLLEIIVNNQVYEILSYPLAFLFGPLFYLSIVGFSIKSKYEINMLTFSPYFVYQIYLIIKFLYFPDLDDFNIIYPIQIVHLLFYGILIKIKVPAKEIPTILGPLIFYFVFTLSKVSVYLYSINNLNIPVIYIICLIIISLLVPGIYSFFILNNSKMEAKGSGKHSELLLLAETINNKIISGNIFLNHDLTIRDLGEIINIPWYTISSAIKAGFNKSYSEYIKYHRIDWAKNLLIRDDYTNYTILGIAQDSGFRSKSTFNKQFKEVVGKTPSEYRAKIKKGR